MTRKKTKNNNTDKVVRCAIYTRKSNEEGLDQDVNTLDALRESGEAYIASQKNEGRECLPESYDGGGFSGSNMERPAFARLLADIEAGKIGCVVVYKVDQLSCSLLDFARIMAVYDQRKVAFVSVTQQFNTSTLMGRLVPAHVDAAFADFDNVWNVLKPHEQAQVLALLIDRVEFNAADSSIAVTFHPSSPSRY